MACLPGTLGRQAEEDCSACTCCSEHPRSRDFCRRSAHLYFFERRENLFLVWATAPLVCASATAPDAQRGRVEKLSVIAAEAPKVAKGPADSVDAGTQPRRGASEGELRKPLRLSDPIVAVAATISCSAARCWTALKQAE